MSAYIALPANYQSKPFNGFVSHVTERNLAVIAGSSLLFKEDLGIDAVNTLLSTFFHTMLMQRTSAGAYYQYYHSRLRDGGFSFRVSDETGTFGVVLRNKEDSKTSSSSAETLPLRVTVAHSVMDCMTITAKDLRIVKNTLTSLLKIQVEEVLKTYPNIQGYEPLAKCAPYTCGFSLSGAVRNDALFICNKLRSKSDELMSALEQKLTAQGIDVSRLLVQRRLYAKDSLTFSNVATPIAADAFNYSETARCTGISIKVKIGGNSKPA